MMVQAASLGLVLLCAACVAAAARYAGPRLTHGMRRRRERISGGLEAAARGARQLDQAAQVSERMLQDVREQAREILEEANRQARGEMDDAEAAARAERQRIVQAARDEVEQELQRARESVRREASRLAADGIERVVAREADGGIPRRRLEKFTNQVE